VVFALITLTVGLVARQTVRESYATPFFHPLFTDTLEMKAWLMTAAVVLACGQLLTAARIYELLHFPPKGRFYHSVHRWSGRAAIVFTLPVAYHCVFLLGFRYPQPARFDSLAARVGPLRRRRREGANRSVNEVRPLGAPRGWKPLVLNPPGAVADFRALVFHRRCRYPMSGADGSYLA